MNITRLILLLVFLEETKGMLSKLEKLKNKMKKIYKNKFGKKIAWQFLGLDPSEYPRTDDKYRQINKRKWDEYYTCLTEQNNNLGEHNSVTPEAIQAYEGGSVKFECKVCISPEEQINTDSIEWEWADENSDYLKPVDYDEHILLSPEDKSLHIYNLKIEQTGQYLCRLGDSLTAPYYLTVVNGSLNMSVVHTENAPEGPYPKKSEQISSNDLLLDTEWSPWSLCSKCNQIGRKHRLGYCIVIYKYFDQPDQIIKFETSTQLNKSIESTTRIKREQQPKPNLIIPQDELHLIKIFKFGIPCRSHILPPSLKELPEVKNRMDEIMVGYCREPCPENKIFEVKDEAGNIIEKANNSAGIYSMLQGPPPVEPAVERRLQYEKKDYAVTLTCPGYRNLNSEAPIQWQIDGKNVVPLLLAKETNGRIYISATDRINIKKVKISDSNFYSCWQHKSLAGTIRLVVERNFHFGFNHHIMLVGMVAIMGTFTYVFIKAFFGRKYAKVYE